MVYWDLDKRCVLSKFKHGGMLQKTQYIFEIMNKWKLNMCLFGLLAVLMGIGMTPAQALDARFVYGAVELNEKIETADTAMKTAHLMAECARALPLEAAESDLVIGIAQNHYSIAEELRSQYQEELSGIGSAVLEYDAFTISGLSAKAFDYILEGTNLDGMGYAFEELEQEYGVNGLFAMAVAQTETGFGRSEYARNKNNFFGMLGCSYETKYDGIMAFGKLMNKPIYYQNSIDRIGKTYCPPNASEWSSQNKFLMGSYWSRLEEAEAELEDVPEELVVMPVPGFLQDLCPHQFPSSQKEIV